jgi:hypothetical protein
VVNAAPAPQHGLITFIAMNTNQGYCTQRKPFSVVPVTRHTGTIPQYPTTSICSVSSHTHLDFLQWNAMIKTPLCSIFTPKRDKNMKHVVIMVQTFHIIFFLAISSMLWKHIDRNAEWLSLNKQYRCLQYHPVPVPIAIPY